MDLVFESVSYADPAVQPLLAEIAADQTVRYGGPDESAVAPEEFEPPNGVFLLVRLDGEPVGCAGWKASGEHDAELKRMYTVPAVRGRGVAKALLAAVEDHARAAGRTRVVLGTGDKQPEAIGLYERCGYLPVEPFGHYKEYDSARHYGRDL